MTDGGDHKTQQIRAASVKGADMGFDGIQLRADRLARQSLEQRFLAVEVEIDRALADAGAPRNVLHARGSESIFREGGQRCVQDFRRAGPFATIPALDYWHGPPLSNN